MCVRAFSHTPLSRTQDEGRGLLSNTQCDRKQDTEVGVQIKCFKRHKHRYSYEDIRSCMTTVESVFVWGQKHLLYVTDDRHLTKLQRDADLLTFTPYCFKLKSFNHILYILVFLEQLNLHLTICICALFLHILHKP